MIGSPRLHQLWPAVERPLPCLPCGSRLFLVLRRSVSGRSRIAETITSPAYQFVPTFRTTALDETQPLWKRLDFCAGSEYTFVALMRRYQSKPATRIHGARCWLSGCSHNILHPSVGGGVKSTGASRENYRRGPSFAQTIPRLN